MVVDECFLDFVKDQEKHTLEGKTGKISGTFFILKAFTKRYAIPGVRLGYGFCSDREVLDRMEAVTQPWNVSTMAQQAGMAALKESEYVEAGRQIIFRESAWMKEKMRQVGLTVYPSEANYIFFYGPEDLFERCVAKGILIRDCSNYPGLKKGYYRVAVKLHEQNEKLIEVLEEVLYKYLTNQVSPLLQLRKAISSGWDLLVSGGVQAPSDKLRSSYSVMSK